MSEAVSIRDDEENRCKIVRCERVYDLPSIRLMRYPDAMVEYEVRKIADEWRAALRELVVEALV